MFQRFRTALLALAFAVIAVAPLTGCGSSLSTDQEIQLGNTNAPKFVKQNGGNVPDPTVRAYVDNIGRSLVSKIDQEDRRNYPWEFHVLNTDVINAFALPGGKVFITRGLMVRLSNEAELAGVLGHEVGHVVGQHIGKQMTRAGWLEAGLQVVGAVSPEDWSGIVTGVGGAGGQLYLLKFGRGQELEADDYGATYMTRLDYDPQGLVGVMKVLRDAAGGNANWEMLSTHPHPETRIEALETRLQTDLAFTQNSPRYRLDPQSYQTKALARLKALPPAPKQQAALNRAFERYAALQKQSQADSCMMCRAIVVAKPDTP